ncbi:transglycosylase SLT domain-containing protein [Idiomarina seosinensis]|uniref:Murein transglycosylase n=1 Tax=Idiomarina seosinensis TaxID=281739 RepID=A0A432ZCY2_9GAMM|nr:transglycosylase SLT domain-containing protein [Idiomarina seosinensis]RUO75761.1 murein transglycosylase [Idiomarina seosinensis]
MLIKPLISATILAVSSVGSAQQTEFEQFTAKQQAEFENFEAQRQTEFEEFVKQWRAAEQAYAKQLSKTWEQPELASKKRWVSYSDDAHQKTVIDYQDNTVTVEVQGQVNQQQLLQRLNRRIDQLRNTTVGQAIANDPVVKRLPKPIAINVGRDNNTRLIDGVGQLTKKEIVEHLVTEKNTKRTTKITVKLPDSSYQERVQRVLPSAQTYAQKHGLSVPLMLAIIHTESSFNPLARSHIPAFGLMQIVPTSAGKDVSQFLYGEQRLFAPAYLFDQDNNLEAGSVYFYLLTRRYFKNISDDTKRELMAIAAYNTGPGNVANTFGVGTSLTEASLQANQMTSDQLKQHLMTYLPAQETKNYLTKVLKRKKYYQQLLDAS